MHKIKNRLLLLSFISDIVFIITFVLGP